MRFVKILFITVIELFIINTEGMNFSKPPALKVSDLQYVDGSDFSDIFKGYYQNEDEIEKKLDDDLSNSETNLEQQNSDIDFNDIRKRPIGNRATDYDLGLNGQAKQIAQNFLSKIYFLFYYNVEGSDIFAIANSLGKFNETITNEQENGRELSKGKKVLTSYSVYNVRELRDDSIKKFVSVVDPNCYENKQTTDEQKFFILSIRQAILKIASNPVGRRLFCRILKNIGNKKILILQSKHQDGSFSFYRGLTDRLKGTYVCVTVPWKLGESTSLRPGAGAIKTKTCKQLAVHVNGAIDDNMGIIQSDEDVQDEKPFYISLCHEFIHCLHYLENKIVDLKEKETNKKMFFEVYKEHFWNKNMDLIFQNINFYYLLDNFKDKDFTVDQYKDIYPIISQCKASISDIEKLKSDILIDNLVSWYGISSPNFRISNEKIVDNLCSELTDRIVYSNSINGAVTHAVQTIVNYNNSDLITAKHNQFKKLWNIDDNIRYNLIQIILKSVALKHCLNQLRHNCYFKDYIDGEEVYTVTGLHFETDDKKFVIDNVSELSFNALERNNVIRISYSSACLLSDTNDEIIKKVGDKLSKLIKTGQALVAAKQLIKLLTGQTKFDNLREDEKLEGGLCRRLGLMDADDGFFDFL